MIHKKVPDAHQWEKHVGGDAAERTTKVGFDSIHYREMVHLPPTSDHRRISHETYIHTLGADVLRATFSEEYEAREKQKKFMLQRQVTAIKKIRKRVKVDDFEDGGLSVAIEQDWDTSGWNEELIEAGMESLISIFYNFHGEATIPRKDRALLMIQKLLDRHREADAYLRKNTESLMSQTVSRYIRDGKAAAVLDMLYVLNQTCERIVVEMSNFNFAGKLTEMMLQEARLAAILIQHTFRSMKAKVRLKTTHLSQAFAYFGTERQIYYRQVGVINARSNELRYQWRLFRSFYPRDLTNKVGGLRGPLHIGAEYVHKALSILRVLVSDKAMLLAHSNREEVVHNEGCILLSNFVGTTQSPFAKVSAMILADVSRVVEAFLPMLRSGVIFSAVRYLQYLRKIYRVGSDILSSNTATTEDSSNNSAAQRRAKKTEIIRSFVAAMDMIQHLAIHAAGFYRARYRYQYERRDPASGGLQVTNYLTHLDLLERQSQTGLVILIPRLCPRALLSELSTQILSTSQPTILNHALRALFFLASSECQELVVKEITAMSGTLMAQLVSLLHHPVDHVNRMYTGSLVVALFVQLCSTAATRKALMTMNIPQYLVPLNQRYLLHHAAPPTRGRPNSRSSTATTSSSSGGSRRSTAAASTAPTHPLYKAIDSLEHMRGMLVASMLSRQGEWNYIDPEDLLERMYGDAAATAANTASATTTATTATIPGTATGTASASISNEALLVKATVSVSTWIREALLLDWLRTIKNVNYDGFNGAITIPDLVIMPTDANRAIAASRQAGNLCALEIVHALYHPEEEYYYEALPLHEAVAVVEILESFAAYAQTAKMMFAVELVRFLANFLYLCKYLFLGKPMTTAQVMVLLNGVKASLVCLGRLCAAIEDTVVLVNQFCQWIIKTDLIATNLFFLQTLSTFDEKTDPEIIRLQKIVGISTLAFFHKLAHMLNVHYTGQEREKFDNVHAYGASVNKPKTTTTTTTTATTATGTRPEEGEDRRLLMTVEDLFPSGEITVSLFYRLKDIIHTRHEHYQRDLRAAELLRAQFAHQERPGASSLSSTAALSPVGLRSLSVASTPSASAAATAAAVAAAAERRYQLINNASPPSSPPTSPSPPPRRGSTWTGGQAIAAGPRPHDDPYHATTSVTTHLHPRDEFLQVLDAMCKFLMELTMYSPGAYAAVQEWQVFDTLQRYLPPPLSGLNDASNAFLQDSMYVETRASVAGGLALSRQSVALSRMGGSLDDHMAAAATAVGLQRVGGVGGGGGIGRGSQAAASLTTPLQAALSTAAKLYGANRAKPVPGMGAFLQGGDQALADDPIAQQQMHSPGAAGAGTGGGGGGGGGGDRRVHDDVELIDLPSSYFQLLANLCRIPDGTARCFAEGFLRRALDKSMALYVQLLAHRDPLKKTIVTAPTFPWAFRKLDFIACLRVITATANFHHPKHGSTNDLIFSASYDIVLVCKTLVTLKLKRTEELVLVAYECLAALAQDTYRVNQIFEFHEVYEDIRQELLVLTSHFPVRGVLACLRVIHGSTIGLTSPYLAKMIPKLREPLTKVARLYPQLDEAVRNANWTLTKSAMLYRNTFDASYQVVDEANVEIEEFIRTGTRENIQHYLRGSTSRTTTPPRSGVASTMVVSRALSLDPVVGAGGAVPRSPFGLSLPVTPTVASPRHATAAAAASITQHPFLQPTPTPAKSVGAADSVAKQLFASTQPLPRPSSPKKPPPVGTAATAVTRPRSRPSHVTATPAAAATAAAAAAAREEIAHTTLVDTPGAYSHCGVSTCGSLRVPAGCRDHDHDHDHDHQQQQQPLLPKWSDLTAEETDAFVRELDLTAAYGADVLPISKLSAREPGLHALLAERKGRAGFAPVQKTVIFPRDATASGRSSSPQRGGGGGRATSPPTKPSSSSSSSVPLTSLSTTELPDLRRTRPPPPGAATAVAIAAVAIADPAAVTKTKAAVPTHNSRSLSDVLDPFAAWTTTGPATAIATAAAASPTAAATPTKKNNLSHSHSAPFIASPDELLSKRKRNGGTQTRTMML